MPQMPLTPHQLLLLVLLAGMLLALMLIRIARQAIRRRRPPAPLHPRLQPYAGRSEADIAADRAAAAKVVATSSKDAIAGYDVVRQIEVVFVEGYRTPDEALTALKAAAGRLGANAVINLTQNRTAAGRCSAQGDAVIVRENP